MAVKVNQFPTMQELETVTTLGKYHKLYCNEAFSVFGVHDIIKKQYKKLEQLMYISHAIPARVSDFYGDFVAGDVDDLVILSGTDKQEDQDFIDELLYENDLPEKVSDIGGDQSEFGFAVPYVYLDTDGKTVKVSLISPDQYFPQPDGSVIIATYKLDPRDYTGKRLLLYTQHFQMVNEDVLIERQAFETDDRGVAVSEVGLDRVGQALGYTPEKETRIPGLGQLPMVQIDNGRKQKHGYGKSDYADIIPNLAEVNERTTQISTQFIKNLDAKMQLPAGMRDDDGKVKEPFDTIFVERDDQPEAKYIVNMNPLVAECQDYIMSQLRIISEITCVPMFALLKDAGAPESVQSLRIRLYSADRKTRRKRAKVARGLQDVIRIAFKLAGKEYDTDPEIKFGDVLPKDYDADSTAEATRVQAGISSRRSSIMRLDNISEEDADEELSQIQNEDKVAGITLPTPPAI